MKALEKTQGELNQISAKFNECTSALQAKSAEIAAATNELNKVKEQLANQTSAQASLQKDLDSSKATKDAGRKGAQGAQGAQEADGKPEQIKWARCRSSKKEVDFPC